MLRLKLLCLWLLPTFLYAQPVSTEQQLENLTAFAKLFGYVRYFHPSDEASAIDWDYFAVYGAEKVLNANNSTALQNTLLQLFTPIAPTIKIYNVSTATPIDISSITPSQTKNYETTAWQHLGVDVDNTDNIYQSVRVNRPVKIPSSKNGFAPITQYLQANAYAGKKVKLSGWMKMNPHEASGSGHFWLRVDKEKGTGFFYNMSDKPITTDKWQQYEFEAQIDNDASAIYFGAYLNGSGTLLADDISLKVYENNTWKDIPIANASFENMQNNQPKDWILGATIKGGYNTAVQYRYTFHTDATEGLQSVKIISNDADTMAKANRKNINYKPLFSFYPKPGEYADKLIGAGLRCRVPLALYCNEEGTFPLAATDAFLTLKKEILKTKHLATSGNMPEVRYGGIVIAWNIFRHFFPYWEDASKQADIILKEALTKSLKDNSAADFLVTLKQMTAPLNDGHIWVSLKSDMLSKYTTPLLVTVAEGKLVVEKVFDDSLSKIITTGTIIETVNGNDALTLLQQNETLISGSPQWKRSRATTEYFFGPQGSEVVLGVRSNNNPYTITLKRNKSSREIYKHRDGRITSGLLENGIYYADLNVLSISDIKKDLQTITHAPAVIFDLRGYPNGNHEVISYLLKEKEKTEWMFVPKIIYPDFDSVKYNATGWYTQPDKKHHINGNVIFVTDGRAISYAESFMGHIKDFKLATIVGQPTAGTNGNVNPFSLPGGYNISWTGMLVKNHDGSKHHLIGIVPDVFVERTINGITAGKDELLEKAIEIAKKPYNE